MSIEPRSATIAIVVALSYVTAAAQPAPANSDIDPRAIAALERMGSKLRGLEAFFVASQSSLELVLESGQKVELDTEIAYRVKRPNKMLVELKGGRKDRKIYYDGRNFTVWAPNLNFYATAPEVDRSLAQLFVGAAQRYGVEIPLADLMLWGTEYAPTSSITSAFEVGSMVMNGDRVDQFAYTQGDMDWQLWISRATMLPRKVVITNRAADAQPEFTAFLHWDTKSRVGDAAFTFDPPKGAKVIVFSKLDAADAASAGRAP